jgi:hypothetical protein
MQNHTTVSTRTSTSDFSTRVTCAANDQMDDYLSADADMRYMSDTRTRHHALVNATRKYMDTAATIAFYQQRYGVPTQAPAPVAPYSHEMAIADAQAAGLPYVTARRISLDAVAAGLTGSDYRAFVDAHVAMQLDEQAARRARNAAKWAQISSEKVVA